MLSEVLRAGHEPTAGLSLLSTPDSILMCYQKSRRRQRLGVAQRPGASTAHGYLRICMAGLCYDTQPVEAMTFPVAMPDKTPCALSEDFYQEKLPCKPLRGRFMRNIVFL
jgi:hypothetical protein